jgi:hypothetical protein
MKEASTAVDHERPDESGANGESGANREESGAAVLFPAEGNFSAVVPLSEVRRVPEPLINAPAQRAAAVSLNTRVEARGHVQDEQDEATLVPGRSGRSTAPAVRPAGGRPSWTVMIAALTLSVAAGLTAGIYLIKTARQVEVQAPASITEDRTPEVVGDAKATDARQTQTASEQVAPESSHEASPSPEPHHDADVAASAANVEVRGESAGRSGLSTPKREPAADAAPGRNERATEAPHARALIAEQSPERPARKGTFVTGNTPARPKAVTDRRATSGAERPPAFRAPERPPVSSLPASTKSKKVIQWP